MLGFVFGTALVVAAGTVQAGQDYIGYRYACSLRHVVRNAAGDYNTTQTTFVHEFHWDGRGTAPTATSRALLDGYQASVWSSAGTFHTDIRKYDVQADHNFGSTIDNMELPNFGYTEQLDASYLGEGNFILQCDKT